MEAKAKLESAIAHIRDRWGPEAMFCKKHASCSICRSFTLRVMT